MESAKLLSVNEVAERLGVSSAIVYGLCAQRRLRHERHGLGRGTIRIPEDALENYRMSVTVDAKREAVFLPPPRKIKFKHLSLS